MSNQYCLMLLIGRFFFVPSSYRELVTYAQTKRNLTYICKPETGCQGRGIFITKHVKEIKPHDKLLCQVYISRVSSASAIHKMYYLYTVLKFEIYSHYI